MKTIDSKANVEIPDELGRFFWDVDFSKLSWGEHSEHVAQRVLERGDWKAVKWLAATIGRDGIKGHIIKRRGRGLDPKRLRFWQNILDIPKFEVDSWLADPGRKIWDNRTRRKSLQSRSAKETLYIPR